MDSLGHVLAVLCLLGIFFELPVIDVLYAVLCLVAHRINISVMYPKGSVQGASVSWLLLWIFSSCSLLARD